MNIIVFQVADASSVELADLWPHLSLLLLRNGSGMTAQGLAWLVA
jgi:hypothetical protein